VISRERYLAPLLFLLLAAAYTSPIFSPLRAFYSGNISKDNDWLKIAAFERFARDSLAQGHLAFWCPYFGGGYSLIAHPEDGSLSPLILPSYLVGEEVGMKLQLVIILFLGAWGMYLAARRSFDFSPPAALVSAVGLLVAGWMAWRVNFGWPMHFGYYLFPLVFYFTDRAARDRRWLLAAVATMVVILQQIAQGLVFFFVFLLLWSMACDLVRRHGVRRGNYTLNALLLPAATALAGGAKVAGLLQLMGQNTRWVAYSTYRPTLDFYVSVREWAHYVVQEADVAYKNIGLGWWLAALAVLGVILLLRRVWVLLPGVVLLVWAGMGPHAPVDLFVWLHRLPVFASMHCPLKYTNFFITFALCIFAGAAVEFVARRAKRWQWGIIALVALLPLEPLIAAHMRLLDATFVEDSPPFPLAATPFRQVAAFEGAVRGAHRPLQANMYWLLRQNQGTIDWDGDLLLPEYAAPAERIQQDGSRRPDPNYRGEVYLTVPGRVTWFQIGVNRFAARGWAAQSGRLVLNQNHDPNWRGKPHRPLSENNLLAMPIDAGPFAVEFLYRPKWFFSGLAISLVTWLALGLFWVRETWARGRRSAIEGKENGSDS